MTSLMRAYARSFMFCAVATVMFGCAGGSGASTGVAAQSGVPPVLGASAPPPVANATATPSGILPNVLPTPIAHSSAPLVAASGELAAPADAFVDSFGVNTHFENHYAPDSQFFAHVSNLLVGSGMRHFRVGMIFGSQTYFSEMRQLAAAGVHGLYITAPTLTQAQIQTFPAFVAPSLELYENPNEQDDPYRTGWQVGAASFAAKLYSWVKSDPSIAMVPIVAPSLTSQTSFLQLGSLSASVDYANIHDYFVTHNPGNAGYGSTQPYGVYGSIGFNVNLARVTSGSKPPLATESGYATGAAVNGVQIDYRTQLRYMTRLFFEQYNAGVLRTYTYDLVDGATPPDYGLIDASLHPKPAYYGIKSIIGALSDPGPAFTPSRLLYTLTGVNSAVHHLLLQKRNGSFVLALWIESSDWNTTTGGDLTVPPQTATLTTVRRFSAASIAALDEAGGMATAGLPWNGTSTALTITDKPSLVTLTP